MAVAQPFVTEFTIPTAAFFPHRITAGPDGTLFVSDGSTVGDSVT